MIVAAAMQARHGPCDAQIRRQAFGKKEARGRLFVLALTIMTDSNRSIDFSAVDDTLLLDSEREANFDRLTVLAAKALRAPVALISLIDRNRQFFKSECGLPEPWAAMRQTPLSHSFCQQVVIEEDLLIVEDARKDDRVRDNLAVSQIGVIAYLGVPIRDAQQRTYGAFCAIDSQPRSWSQSDVEILHALAAQVTVEVELRRRQFELRQGLDKITQRETDRKLMTRLTVHDLRTPLQALLMSIDTISLVGVLNEEQQGCLEISRRNGRAIQTMVDSLLDIGAVEQQGAAALRVSLASPSEIVVNAAEQVRPLVAEKGLQLEIAAQPGLNPISLDRDKIVRVLVNLLGNAVKFSQPGARVCMGAGERRDAAGHELVFFVEDEGIGIEPANRKRIFETGIKVDFHASTRVSAGLGLKFCKTIVVAHGGTIWVDSELGKGSVFKFSLPYTD
jgi:signal transduction histidine kinase